MTVTVQELKQTAQTALPDAELRITGTSGEEYPVKVVFVDGDLLNITVEDGVDDKDEDEDDEE